MIYYFTEQQWDILWLSNDNTGWLSDEMNTGNQREKKWNDILCYNENDDPTMPDFYGSIEGDQKDINLFIMKYYLSREQWDKLFEIPDEQRAEDWSVFFSNHKLAYDEHFTNSLHPSYHGCIEGNENDINWFLLKYL